MVWEGPISEIPPLPAVSWTPDSRWLIGGHVDLPGPPGLCRCFGEPEGERLRLTTAPPTSRGDHSPVLSPDGKKLAFLRHLGTGQANVFVLDLDAEYGPRGEPRQLTHEPCCVSNPMWSGPIGHPGREILYVKHERDITTLFRIPADGSGPPQPVSSVGLMGTHFAISRQGDRLVYVSGSVDSDIWRVKLPAGGRGSNMPLPAVRYLSSSRVDEAPQFSPDGKKVVFSSSRSGNLEIWVAEADGSGALQVTSFGGPAAVAPRWSPDGKAIVLHANVDGTEDLYVIGGAGGKPRRLTQGAGNNLFASWSHDGRWIYFSSNRSGEFQCWKMPSGGGDGVQVTRGGGYGGFESPDGRFLYYAKGRLSSAVWRVPVGGGEERPVSESVQSLRDPTNFAVTPSGIYTATSQDALRGFQLQFYRFTAGKPEMLGRIEAPLGTGMAFSPDERWLLFTDYAVRRGDLMLVENFR